MRGKTLMQMFILLFVALTAVATASAYQQAYYTGTYSHNTYGRSYHATSYGNCGNQIGAHTRRTCNNAGFTAARSGYHVAAPYYLGYRLDRYEPRFGHYNARTGGYYAAQTGQPTGKYRFAAYGSGLRSKEFYHPNTWNTFRY